MIAEPQETNESAALPSRRTADWDISNAPRNYLALVIAHAGTALFSFASVWLITRQFGSEGYGVVVAFIAASQLVQIFINWSATSLTRFGIEEFVETGHISRSFWSRSLIFFPNLILVLLASVFWLSPLADALKISPMLAWLIAIHIFTTSVWLHIQYSLQGIKMLRLQGILLAVERAVTFAGLLVLIWLEHLTPEGVLWCYILPPLAMTAIGIVFLQPFLDFGKFYDAAQFRKMLVFSLPLIPFAVVGFLSTSQLDAFFITQYLSTRDLGIYAVAAQINGIALQLPILANTVLLSISVSLRSEGKESLLQKIYEVGVPVLTMFWATVCVALAIICSLLLPLIFGNEFTDAGVVLWILVTASISSFPVLVGYATLSNTYSRTYISMYASIAAALANVVFNILLIPKFGKIGCAWATVLSALSSLAVFYVLLRKENLLRKNPILSAILPAAAGALILSLGFGQAIAFTVFVLITFFVAYLNRTAVQYTVRLVKGRLNVKNVPPEPSIR